MAIRAKTLITLTQERQVTTVRNFYKATSTNTKPSAISSSSISDWTNQGWLTAEPAYNASTPYVWLCMQTLFGEYNATTNPNNYINSEVSLSSSYTAAISANVLAESIAANTASFWTRYTDGHDKNDSSIPILAGAYASSNPHVDYLDTSTFDYNSYFGANALTFRYKTLNLAKYGTSGVQIYKVATGTTYKLSTDTTVNSSKTYYIYDNNTFVKVDSPSGNPQINNYYEAVATLSQSDPVIELTYDIIDKNGTPDIENRLTFYDPKTNNRSMELKDSELAFYLPNTGTTKAASLTSTGITLQKGGLQAGIPNQNKFVYLSTEDYPLRQYTKTQDSAIEDGKDYYILDNNIFILVEEPISTELASYYEVSVDGISVNGYAPTEAYSNPAWRMIIGTNFGVDNCGTLYATNANISGVLNITDGNVYTKEDTINNINNVVDNIENQTIYAYSNNSNGSDYNYTNNTLRYRGILVVSSQTNGEIIIPPEKQYVKTLDTEIDENKTYYELINNEFVVVEEPDVSEINNYYEFIDEEPNKFNWEINPLYAEQNASNYIANIEGGMRIGTSNSSAYLTLSASLMQFWLNQKSMAHFGYDKMYESYGITVENVMITGAGNALRLDNGLNGTYQGQFILETRSNGHLSLKPGLKRDEEEEEI